jgi:hypothetical protein
MTLCFRLNRYIIYIASLALKGLSLPRSQPLDLGRPVRILVKSKDIPIADCAGLCCQWGTNIFFIKKIKAMPVTGPGIL